LGAGDWAGSGAVPLGVWAGGVARRHAAAQSRTDAAPRTRGAVRLRINPSFVQTGLLAISFSFAARPIVRMNQMRRTLLTPLLY